jgi:hypothetical protein
MSHIGEFVHWGGEVVGDGLKVVSVLGLITLGVVVFSQLVPSWLLLARSLPRHGRVPRGWQAVDILWRLMFRGLQARSVHKAARLRIEIELLNPFPEAPLRLDHDTRKDFNAAKLRWRQDKSAWKADTKRRLGALIHEEETGRSVIEVDTCTAVVGSDAIKNYFDALARQRLRTHQDPVFLSKVTIRSGFVAPLHLITGVLARYEEDWQPVVEAYGLSVIRPDDDLRYRAARKIQSFIFDCWMLWGPSISICTCPEWHGEVALQYGYGDEDNSLILRCSSPEILRTLSALKGVEPDVFARQTRVSGTLRWGPSLGDTGFCPAQRAIWRDNRLVLEIIGQANEGDGIRPAGGTEAQVYSRYYSAYLWITFVICRPDTEEPLNPDDKWRDLIPFFAHGNIAEDPGIYEFHKSQLARGALEGALQLLRHGDNDPDEPKIALRFVCAIDESGCGYPLLYPMAGEKTIRGKMIDFVEEARAVASEEDRDALSRLNLEFHESQPYKDGDYSACAMPEIVNEYYNEIKEERPDCLELRLNHKADRKLLKRFYEECFVPEVPDPNERDSLRDIQHRLKSKQDGKLGKNNYHVLVLLEDDKPVGGAVADYFDKPNAGVIEYMVIQPKSRAKGLGNHLREQTERLLHEDAVKSGHRELDWIAAEMDDPYLTPVLTSEFDPFSRARIWDKWGYRVLDFPYVQPALSAGKRPVDNLLLMVKTCSERFDDAMPSGHVEALVTEYLMWSMQSAPDAARQLEEMRRFLHARSSVGLRSFSEYLGWDEERQVHVSEVLGADDAELGEAIRVYKDIFTDRGPALANGGFENAFGPDGLSNLWAQGYRYHLWTLRGQADGQREGVACFLTMPSAGFGRCFGFIERVRGPHKLDQLVARAEEQMVRDRGGHLAYVERLSRAHRLRQLGARVVRKVRAVTRAGEVESSPRGWYIECANETECKTFATLGFRGVEVNYRPPRSGTGGCQGASPHLMYKPFGRVYADPHGTGVIDKPAFVRAIGEIYTSVYRVEPSRDPAFMELVESLKHRETIRLKPQ